MNRLSSSEVSLLLREQIKKRRKQLGLTFNEVAELMHVSDTTIKSYEAGLINISAVRLYALSKVLNVPIGYFFEEEETEMGYEEEHKKWNKYKTFMSDYDYKYLQAAIDKICDEKIYDERRLKVKELLEKIKTYGRE